MPQAGDSIPISGVTLRELFRRITAARWFSLDVCAFESNCSALNPETVSLDSGARISQLQGESAVTHGL